mgnify:CR=1 FL=1
MRILHYSLGFPPARTGGLVEYALDLAETQAATGNNVFFLYPGKINLLNKKVCVEEDKKSNVGFSVYSLINSLPLPLFGGIKNPEDFMVHCSEKVYVNFLKKIKPDIIHVHTIMGIHREFFDATKKLGIKTIFTTHDYFGLAPEPNFFYEGQSYIHENSEKKWMEIAEGALPTWKLRIFQSKYYKYIRFILKKIHIKKQTMQKNNMMQHSDVNMFRKEDLKGFLRLKQYYLSIFELIDFFHFNSTVSKSIYLESLSNINGKVISISNSRIKRRNTVRISKTDILNIGYIGPYKEYKGFFEFLKFAEIIKENKKNKFHIYGSNDKVRIPYFIENHGRYNAIDFDEVFNSLDILIVPSIWYETFGFIVAEALNFKVKVIVRDTVGAKDIVDQNFIFKKIEDIPGLMKKLDYYQFRELKDIKKHSEELSRIYTKLIEEEQ